MGYPTAYPRPGLRTDTRCHFAHAVSVMAKKKPLYISNLPTTSKITARTGSGINSYDKDEEREEARRRIVCPNIERNVRTDSGDIRRLEHERNLMLENQRTLEAQKRQIEINLARLVQENVQLPHLPGPPSQTPVQALRGFARALAAFGIVVELIVIADSIRRTILFRNAMDKAERDLANIQTKLNVVQQSRANKLDRIQELDAAIQDHYAEYASTGCHGDLDSYYLHAPGRRPPKRRS